MKQVNLKRPGVHLLTIGALLLLTAGCGKNDTPATGSPGLATQATSAEAANTYADAQLADLTRELRRWIVATKKRPASFEEFATSARVTVPPAPAGKKFAISKEMHVILVDR